MRDQFGALVKYRETLPKLIAKKIDIVLMRNLVFSCRGYLARQSLKKANKWSTNCFAYIDMEMYASLKGDKVLNCYSINNMFYECEIY